MERLWTNQGEDSGAVHCFGNGDFLLYAQGPVLSQIQGPPYTMPSFARFQLQEKNLVTCSSFREEEANIWHHILQMNGKKAEFCDYLLPDKNVFVREYRTDVPFTIQLQAEEDVEIKVFPHFLFDQTTKDCLMLRLPMGKNFFTSLSVEEETWLAVVLEGGSITPEGNLLLEGNGRLLLSSGLLPDAVSQMSWVLERPSEQLSNSVRSYWKTFLSGVSDLGKQLPEQFPNSLRQKVSSACKSVAMLIKCQQSRSGGIQAGHPYPLAYVRDMAGTMRGMLSLGMKGEARSVLQFWYNRFCLFGNLRNAEGMGNKGGRLYFPNDEVEVPAYLIISAFWYAAQTGDKAILEEIFPMLQWAFEVQLPQLGGGMTSFSGDETYIAGGTLPRVLMYDGSAESTLLFLEGGERFVRWCQEHEKLEEPVLAQYHSILRDVRARYKDNFCVDGLIYANNPSRLEQIKRPRFARGFCEVHDTLQHQLVLGWLMYDPDNGYYCCPDCYGKIFPSPIDRKKRHLLSSVSLLPAFYESSLFSSQELTQAAAPYITLFEKNGFVPSNAEGNRSLGYDYGLFLYTLSVLHHPLRLSALSAMMEVLDETGAWVEYYDDKKPYNCRCRPWESGINIDAIRRLVESFL